MTSDIIRTENLSKHYKDVFAVSDLSLNVRKGEIYGFLGLNGAGKTTTIRMLLGLIRPTSGMALIKGQKISAENTGILKYVGSLVEIPYSYPELTVHENLDIIRRMRFIDDKKIIDNVIDSLGLSAYADRKAKNLSLGNNQRLGLAKALIHKPEILILDEPSNGLDPAGIYDIREMLSNLSLKNGVTVFISSHILGEISRFATRIGIIHEGKLVKEIDSGRLEILCEKRLLISANNIDLAFMVLTQKGYNTKRVGDDLIEIKDSSAVSNPDTVATIMVNSGCPPTLLKVEEEDLESYFLRTIGMKGSVK